MKAFENLTVEKQTNPIETSSNNNCENIKDTNSDSSENVSDKTDQTFSNGDVVQRL